MRRSRRRRNVALTAIYSAISSRASIGSRGCTREGIAMITGAQEAAAFAFGVGDSAADYRAALIAAASNERVGVLLLEAATELSGKAFIAGLHAMLEGSRLQA